MGIRVMRPEDIPFVVSLVCRESWTYAAPEIERMLRLDPGGSFVFEDEEPLGVVNAITYGRTGFIGILVVSEKGRGRRIGQSLLNEAIGYCESKGAGSVLLYATTEGVKLYEKHGFRKSEVVHCIKADVRPGEFSGPSPGCTRITPEDLGRVLALDREMFGDDRGRLIRMLYDEFPESAFKIERGGRLLGYALGRKTEFTVDFGPWVCTSRKTEDASALLTTTMSSLGSGEAFFGVFEENKDAIGLIDPITKKRTWRTVQMFKGEDRYQGHVDDVYGVIGFELG